MPWMGWHPPWAESTLSLSPTIPGSVPGSQRTTTEEILHPSHRAGAEQAGFWPPLVGAEAVWPGRKSGAQLLL